MRRFRMFRLAILALSVALLIGAASPGVGTPAQAAQAAPTGVPTLRLMVTEPVIEHIRPEGGYLAIEQLPTFIATVGGTFEVHVRRDGAGFATEQVVRNANGDITQRVALPRSAVADITQGFQAFFRVALKSEAGDVLHTASVPFCPLTGERSKVEDNSAPVPTFPWYCFASELTQAMVWGIDAGWAARGPESIFVNGDFPDGTYQLDVEINRKFRSVFRIPDAEASASFTLIVTTDDRLGGGVGIEEEPLPQIGDIHGRHGHSRDVPEVSAAASGLPDLIALPPFNINVASPDDPDAEGRDAIIFGANVWNGGEGPLVVEGFRRPGEAVMDAYQYFYEGGVLAGRELVGELEYDPIPGHRHWHFRDFAQYSIVDDAGTVVAVSGKEAFCLAPTDPIDLTLPNANYRPFNTGLATSCGFFGAIWIREILDVGWGDTYYQSVPGQWIDITDVPNGEYLLQVVTNADGRLRELRSDNNVATTRILLGGVPGARTVQVVGG